MKVTQIIRDAIESAVNAKAQEKIDMLTKEQAVLYKDIEKLEHDFDALIKNTINTWVVKVLENNREISANNRRIMLCDNRYTNFGEKISSYYLEDRLKSDYTCKTQDYGFHLSTEGIKKNKQEIEEIRLKAKETVNSIILDLELGSKNKAEVQNLLGKVKF